jgi:hypothetical protein
MVQRPSARLSTAALIRGTALRLLVAVLVHQRQHLSFTALFDGDAPRARKHTTREKATPPFEGGLGTSPVYSHRPAIWEKEEPGSRPGSMGGMLLPVRR